MFDVNERDKKCVHRGGGAGSTMSESHGVNTLAEATLERVQLWKDVGRNTGKDQVLENFERA